MAQTNCKNLYTGSPVPVAAGEIAFVDSLVTIGTSASGNSPVASGDTVVLKPIPAGFKLVPHLFRVCGNELDTNASPTGTFSVGTAAAPTAILNAGAGGNANNYLDLGANVAGAFTGTIGSATADTPMLLTISGTVATAATSGSLLVRVPVMSIGSGPDL